MHLFLFFWSERDISQNVSSLQVQKSSILEVGVTHSLYRSGLKQLALLIEKTVCVPARCFSTGEMDSSVTDE